MFEKLKLNKNTEKEWFKFIRNYDTCNKNMKNLDVDQFITKLCKEKTGNAHFKTNFIMETDQMTS